MELTKPIAALLVASLLAAGAATAAPGALSNTIADETSTATDAPASVDASATYDNGTVTVTVTGDDGGLAGVDVYADGEKVGTTDENGTVTFDAGDADELEIEMEGDGFEGELEYAVQDDSLSLLEEEYEYERADEEVEDDEAEDDEADDEEAEDDESEETEEDDDETEDSDDIEDEDSSSDS